jgi:hypothetical protein
MSKIEIARLYARTRSDGAVTLSGRIGYDGRLRIVPNENKVEGDDKSPDFLAFIETAEPKSAQPYRGPQLLPPQRPVAAFVEGEVVE